MSPPKVLAVFLQYSDAHQASGMKALSNLSKWLFPGSVPSFLIVDNKLERHQETQVEQHVNVISGDNSCREFSGYDRGLRWHESFGPIAPSTPVVIANDTFHRHYGDGYLKLFTPERLARAMSANGVLGYVDAFPQPQSVFGLEFQKWIRTSLFIAPYGVITQISPFSRSIKQGSVFRADADPIFFSDDAPLSPWYKSFIRSWLFAQAPEEETFKPEWHSKEPLSASNVGAMRAKALCILCEHAMSARAKSLGIPLTAVNEENLPLNLR